MNWIIIVCALAIGMVIGGFIVTIALSLCKSAGDADDRDEKEKGIRRS